MVQGFLVAGTVSCIHSLQVPPGISTTQERGGHAHWTPTLPSLEQPWAPLPCWDSKVIPFNESFQEENQPQVKGEGALQGEEDKEFSCGTERS